jgi:hypothetical protein
MTIEVVGSGTAALRPDALVAPDVVWPKFERQTP